MASIRPFAAAAILLAGGVTASPGAGEKDSPAHKAFKAHLEKTFAGKKWQVGPKRLDTPELARAYPGREAWYVHSSPPLPPGAPLPDLLEAYQQRMEEYRTKMIAAAALVDADGGVHPVKGPGDFNRGLMKVESEDDARIAAAAILSLASDGRVGPGAVRSMEIEVRKSEAGWVCQATRKFNFQAEVHFDGMGQCTKVSKVSIAPLPP